MSSDKCPPYASFFGSMGATSAVVFSAFGAAYGTARSGCGIAAMAVMKPEFIMRSIFPVIMAGIIGIYGLIVGAVISAGLKQEYSLFTITFVPLFSGFMHLGGGLSVGITGLAAGYAIGVVGDTGVRGSAHQPRLFVGMLIILIFAEVLALYGLIVALMLITKSGEC